MKTFGGNTEGFSVLYYQNSSKFEKTQKTPTRIVIVIVQISELHNDNQLERPGRQGVTLICTMTIP